MAARSRIEWTQDTWNPIAGCSVHSPGCTNCYAMKRVAPRLAANPATPHYAGTVMPSKAGPVFTGVVNLASDAVLTKPLRWKKPRMIFVNSTSDLFHENVPDAWIDRVFAVMALAPQHTFQILTKRAQRMRGYLTKPHKPGRSLTVLDDGSIIDTPAAQIRAHTAMCELFPKAPPAALNAAAKWQDERYPGEDGFMRRWPLPNVWLGVSAERRQEWLERTGHLRQTPAAIRFVSVEPLLNDLGELDLDGIHQVIVGGESGKDARPTHPAWVRPIRNQCAAAQVPFFFKQWGEWAPASVSHEIGKRKPDMQLRNGVWTSRLVDLLDPDVMIRVGKKAAGRLLDGVEHNGMPAIREVPAL